MTHLCLHFNNYMLLKEIIVEHIYASLNSWLSSNGILALRLSLSMCVCVCVFCLRTQHIGMGSKELALLLLGV